MVGSPHIQYHLLWSSHLLSFHSHTIETDINVYITALRDLQKNISAEYQDLSKMYVIKNYCNPKYFYSSIYSPWCRCAENKFTLEYYESLSKYSTNNDSEDDDLSALLEMDRSNPFAAPSKKRAREVLA